MSCRLLTFGFIAALSSTVAEKSYALGFGCAGVAGEVIFMDTLYGTGTGAVIAGVVELTRDDHDDWGQRLATGAAIGAGVGLALGIVEVAVRDCEAPSRVNHTFLQTLPLGPKLIVLAPAENQMTARGWGGGIQVNFDFSHD